MILINILVLAPRDTKHWVEMRIIMRKIIVATGNEGKMKEIRQILAGDGIEYVSLKDENLQDVEPIIRAADAAGEREYLVGSGIAVVDGVIYFVHGERVFELP